MPARLPTFSPRDLHLPEPQLVYLQNGGAMIVPPPLVLFRALVWIP